ncbi:acid-sensing ion channel 1 [Patella vulgata]|uniref:acid-sensing ion channel 1 n=1 Tax=Patella vulgata TaxID=6465 RepID=UPI0021804AB5|nr:acid-sensing ion channel 1 [Patella vulgata]
MKSQPEDDGCSIKHIVGEVTAHGCRNVISPVRSKFVRLVWLLCVLGMTVGLAVTLYDLLDKYRKYHFNTAIKIEPKCEQDFPTITLCDMSYTDTQKFKHPSAVFDYFLKYSSYRDRVRVNESATEHIRLGKFTIDRFHDIANISTKDVIKSCFWKNKFIPCEVIWKPVFTDMGTCFVFNHDIGRLRKTDATGITGGINFIAAINQKGYILTDSSAAGLKMAIHDPHEHPHPGNNGIAIAPGEATLIGIRKTSYKFLPAPYKAFGFAYCIANDDPSLISKMRYSSVYNREKCIRECLGELTVKNCSCKSVTEPETLEFPYCTLNEFMNCYRITLEYYYGFNRSDVFCDCPRVCSFNKYETRISTAKFPSKPAMDVLVQSSIVNNATDAQAEFLDVTVFYEDMVLTENSHIPEYTWNSIMGTLGGQMGLFLGASFITLAEFIEILLLSVWRSFKKIRCCWSLNIYKQPNTVNVQPATSTRVQS